MRKVIVFKHVAHEVLGTITPLFRDQGFRIRYVNFQRTPDVEPSLEKYQGLVIFGGWMGVYEADRYPHLKVECRLIEEALKREIPILGICLGAQILAHTLGANVRKHTEKEVGWQDVALTPLGRKDFLLSHFGEKEKLFQMHGDTFDIPASAAHLACSPVCDGQAFRYGRNAYGLQFHLEVDQAMMGRFLQNPESRQEVEAFGGKQAIARMEHDTKIHLQRSIELSSATFRKFIELFGVESRSQFTRSGHGRPG